MTIQVEFGPALSGRLQCLEVCCAKAGRPLSAGILAGLFGHAFESSHALGGAELWSACALEWSRFDGDRRLGIDQETVDLIGNSPAARPIPSDRERSDALERAREAARRSIECGIPALIWQPMSLEQKAEGSRASCWGLAEGFDEASGEYLVCHPCAGRSRVRYDLIGRADPVQWLHVVGFGGLETGYDPAAAARGALSDALALLAGEAPSANMPAPREALRHGTAAFKAWAEEIEKGRRGGCPGFWARARTAAAEFCRWAASAVPCPGSRHGAPGPGSRMRAPAVSGELGEAASRFEEQAAVFARIAGGEYDASLARHVAEIQESAISALRRATDR
ncbi:MAG: hypothetical protein HY720_29745 [Planctomycetes bacterium]|nr:hypothetical protein [Planctomycetota bacterium]